MLSLPPHPIVRAERPDIVLSRLSEGRTKEIWLYPAVGCPKCLSRAVVAGSSEPFIVFSMVTSPEGRFVATLCRHLSGFFLKVLSMDGKVDDERSVRLVEDDAGWLGWDTKTGPTLVTVAFSGHGYLVQTPFSRSKHEYVSRQWPGGLHDRLAPDGVNFAGDSHWMPLGIGNGPWWRGLERSFATFDDRSSKVLRYNGNGIEIGGRTYPDPDGRGPWIDLRVFHSGYLVFCRLPSPYTGGFEEWYVRDIFVQDLATGQLNRVATDAALALPIKHASTTPARDPRSSAGVGTSYAGAASHLSRVDFRHVRIGSKRDLRIIAKIETRGGKEGYSIAVYHEHGRHRRLIKRTFFADDWKYLTQAWFGTYKNIPLLAISLSGGQFDYTTTFRINRETLTADVELYGSMIGDGSRLSEGIMIERIPDQFAGEKPNWFHRRNPNISELIPRIYRFDPQKDEFIGGPLRFPRFTQHRKLKHVRGSSKHGS